MTKNTPLTIALYDDLGEITTIGRLREVWPHYVGSYISSGDCYEIEQVLTDPTSPAGDVEWALEELAELGVYAREADHV